MEIGEEISLGMIRNYYIKIIIEISIMIIFLTNYRRGDTRSEISI